MRSVLTLTLSLMAVVAFAQSGQRLFSVHDVLSLSPKRVDGLLGKPRSVGEEGKFREYAAKTAGVYVGFRAGKARTVVVTFLTPFSRPADAAAALGIDVSKAKPKRKTISEREWRNVDGIPYIHLSSSDGRLWETIEVGEVPKP
ncbi:MAG: hypothetical protein ACKO5K_01650 [Armatimonadota bacterium]